MNLEAAAQAIDAFLQALDVQRDTHPETEKTPLRVAQAFAEELLRGYQSDPATILSQSLTTSQAKGIVVVRDIHLATTCPHHLLPAFGSATLGYWPTNKVVGFGALTDLVDCLSRRLVLQEDLSQSIADALAQHLDANAAFCIIHLRPSCVIVRDLGCAKAVSTTVAYAGPKLDDPNFRHNVTCALNGMNFASKASDERI